MKPCNNIPESGCACEQCVRARAEYKMATGEQCPIIPPEIFKRSMYAADPSKVIPVAYRSLGVRWDGVEHFLVLLGTGEMIDLWEHISMNLSYGYLKDAKYDQNLARG